MNNFPNTGLLCGSVVVGIVAAIILVEAAFSSPGVFQDSEVVEFESASYTYSPTPFAVKRAKKKGITLEAKVEPAIALSGYLSRPRKDGSFPAVVLLHSCAGITEHEDSWASRLVTWGYVVLTVDSLNPRGENNICDGRQDSTTPWERALDAYGAKNFLSTQAFVDPNRIAVMGVSHGATAILEIIKQSTSTSLPTNAFRAAVAFYPLCGEPEPINTPTLVMIGGKDSWTPAKQCVQYLEKLQQPSKMTLRVFPEAHHLFDHPEIDMVELGRIIRSEPNAAAEAMRLTREFLSEH